ncbi:hypothetical protein BGZ76_006224 [Entomortierella beljakovae]|nr:hypothetical protein BGZ76_006224 [Entomortierella beljakovae]
MPASTDPLREWISNFKSGLWLFKKALRHRHNSKVRRTAWKLSFLCLFIQSFVIASGFILPSFYSTLRQLFYPTIILLRYTKPKSWDLLFMGAVQDMGYSERPDIAAKPNPDWWSQLKGYFRRTLGAYLGVYLIHNLINRTGILKYPSIAIALLALDYILQYRRTKSMYWSLVIVAVFIGPRWPVWIIQRFILQQLLMYELLQPYLSRVNFRSWEERAWLDQYSPELQGFAFGAWLFCSIPWLGAGAVPFLFPATAFFLTRSCGSFENSSQGDILEKRNPGVKSVSRGESVCTDGSWDGFNVRTAIRGVGQRNFKPKEHSKEKNQKYSVDLGFDSPVPVDQIQADKEKTQARKFELINQPWPNWNPRLSPNDPRIHNNPYYPINSSPSYTSASTYEPRFKSQPPPSQPVSSTRQEDFTMYDFSDRKTLESVPSAPFAPVDGILADTGDIFRASPTEEPGDHRSRSEGKVDEREARKKAKKFSKADNKAHHSSSSHKRHNKRALNKSESKSDNEDDVERESEEADGVYYSEGDYDYDESTYRLPRGRRGQRRGFRGFRGFRGGRGSHRQRDILGRDNLNRTSGIDAMLSQGTQFIEEQVGQNIEGWGKNLMRMMRRAKSNSK